MRLISLKSNKESFKTVIFNKTGLNFIIAKQKNPEESNFAKTYNGVGKSLLISIIHFCLGADKKNYKPFCEELQNWNFTLEFKIKDEIFTTTRTTGNPDKIILNNKSLSINDFNDKLQLLCFKIPVDINFLSFRSLIHFFIRPNRSTYSSFDSTGEYKNAYQIQLFKAFFLGLDMNSVQEKHDLKEESDRIKTLERNIKNDDLLKKFFSSNKDINLTTKELENQIAILELDLGNFEVANDYYEVKSNADKIQRKLSEKKNNIILLENQLRNIEESLKNTIDIDKEVIKKTYEETKIIFPNHILKTIDQLDIFYTELKKNRQERFLKIKNEIIVNLEQSKKKAKELENQFNESLKYLNAHKALDVLIKVSSRLSDIKKQHDDLIKYDQLLSKYKNKELEIKGQFIETDKRTTKYLNDISSINNSTYNYFNNFFNLLSKKFYPDAPAGITIKNNTGKNQIRFNIDAKIEADASDGINNVKTFCYDMALLFQGYGHHINFIFHDSRIFEGIDERQKTEMFKILYEYFNESYYQYIATINQNQLEDIKKYIDNFNVIITENIILELTDNSDAEKLLGIKVNI
ncbi:MAG: DUF2326 domain-containing protein [bacterium]